MNADVLARELALEAYAAAQVTEVLRRELIRQRTSFVFETVFSDPAGDKLKFFKEVLSEGNTVVLCFIGIDSPEISEARVAMRVSQGGHDVPTEKLAARYPRTLTNLRQAIQELPFVLLFDNSDLGQPYRRFAKIENSKPVWKSNRLPKWFRPLIGN